MNIVIEDSGSAATLTLSGRFDIAGAEAVALPLATLSGSKSAIVVDMTGVTYLASIGLRHLIAASKALTRRGGRLVLRDPSQAVSEVVATAGLADLLPIERSAAGPG